MSVLLNKRVIKAQHNTAGSEEEKALEDLFFSQNCLHYILLQLLIFLILLLTGLFLFIAMQPYAEKNQITTPGLCFAKITKCYWG